jgi:hypothetical protein
MCMDKIGDMTGQTDAPDPTAASVTKAGLEGSSSGAPAGARPVSKITNNPLLQGGAAAAGAALAPATAGLSLLIPVAAKLLGGLFGKKQAPNFNPNAGGNTTGGLDAMAAKSFGGV